MSPATPGPNDADGTVARVAGSGETWTKRGDVWDHARPFYGYTTACSAPPAGARVVLLRDGREVGS